MRVKIRFIHVIEQTYKLDVDTEDLDLDGIDELTPENIDIIKEMVSESIFDYASDVECIDEQGIDIKDIEIE